MKKQRLSITDFTFRFVGYGTYSVTFQSPVTFKCWSIRTTNMPLIDCTKNAENVKHVDLIRLKKLCKNL